MITLTLIGLGLLGLLLIIFPGLRVLLKGLGNKLIEDRAKTPEGAKIIYDENIKEKRKEYSKAKDILNGLTGALETAKINKANSEKKLANAQHQCEVLMQRGQESDAGIMAQDVMEAKKEIKIYESQIAKLEPARDDADRIAVTIQKQLKQLESDKNINVKDLELNLQTKELFDSLDTLRHSKPVVNMLRTVEDGIQETREQAVGAKTVYENQLSTKKERILDKVNDAETDEYLASLRDKYKK